jgi:hypothetical protein
VRKDKIMMKLENNFAVTTVNTNKDRGVVTTFTFATPEGTQLTVNGALAGNVCDFMNMDLHEKMGGIYKGYVFAKAKKLDIDWKSQFGVKSAKEFYVKMLGIDPSQFDNYSLAVERFYWVLGDEIKATLPCVKGLTIGKLIKLGIYYSTIKKNNPKMTDDEVDKKAKEMIVNAFTTGTLNPYMTDKAIEKAIKDSFNVVDETNVVDEKPEDKKPEDKKPEDKKPEDKKPEDKKPEDKKPEDKKPEDKAKPKDMINEQSVMYTALKKLGTAMDLYESIKGMEIKTEKERKLESVIKAFVSASEYTMEIFK